MDLLKIMEALATYTTIPHDPEAGFDGENAIQELDTLDQMQADAEKYRTYAQENPDDPISAIGLLLAKYTEKRPYHSWDWHRMREVAEVTVPLVNLIKDIDPDAEISMELGGIIGNDAVLTIVSAESSGIDIVPAKIKTWRDAMQKINSFEAYPMTNDRVGIMVVFHGVRKAEK